MFKITLSFKRNLNVFLGYGFARRHSRASSRGKKSGPTKLPEPKGEVGTRRMPWKASLAGPSALICLCHLVFMRYVWKIKIYELYILIAPSSIHATFPAPTLLPTLPLLIKTMYPWMDRFPIGTVWILQSATEVLHQRCCEVLWEEGQWKPHQVPCLLKLASGWRVVRCQGFYPLKHSTAHGHASFGLQYLPHKNVTVY